MKVTCTQEALARGLSIVGRAVAARSPLPITANVLIASEDGRLKLTATNLEITMSAWINAEIEEEGAITVPSRLLSDFVNTLPNERISIVVAPRSRQVKLACARNEASIGGLDAEDFPPAPVVKDGVSVQLDPKGLRQAIAQTVFAAATDDSRPVLTGVDTKFEDNMLTLAASDGFRLSVFKLPLQSPVSEPTEIVIPARALGELQRLLGRPDATRANRILDERGREIPTVNIENRRGGEEEVTTLDEPVEEPIILQTNAAKTQVAFRLPHAELISQLIQGTFPNFNQLIPASYNSKAVAEVAEFLRETRIASVFARDGSGIVRLVVTPGEGMTPGRITVSAKADEVGDNQGDVDAAVEGEGVKIAFNGKYLQDVLQALDGGQLAMETTGPSSQGVFRAIGDENYVHVIMPMFVQW